MVVLSSRFSHRVFFSCSQAGIFFGKDTIKKMKRAALQSIALRSEEAALRNPFVAKASRGINKVILLGNAGAEPKMRTYNDGTASVTYFPLATNQIYTNKSGERVNKPQWHNIVIYNDNLSQVAQKTVKKGSLVYVEGALSTRTYKDATGAEKTICEIILPKYKGDLNVLSKREGQDEEAGHEVDHHELVEDKENVTLA